MKVLSIQDKIITTYSDASFGVGEFGKGMNIYNLECQLLNQYNCKTHSIFDNYGLLKKDNESFYFMPFDLCINGLDIEKSLVEYNLNNDKQRVLFSISGKVNGIPHVSLDDYQIMAFTKKEERWYFVGYGTKKRSTDSFIFEIGENLEILDVKKLGGIYGNWKGLYDGKFASIGYEPIGNGKFLGKQIGLIEL